MIKICVAGKDCTSGGATAQYYTVEVRTHYTASPGFDYYLQNEGVIIHYYRGDWTGPTHNSCYFNYQFGPAYPIDNFNVVTSSHYAGPPSCSEYVGSSYDPVGLRYANWNDGQTFSATGISIAIVSHSTVGGVTTYVVSVNGVTVVTTTTTTTTTATAYSTQTRSSTTTAIATVTSTSVRATSYSTVTSFSPTVYFLTTRVITSTTGGSTTTSTAFTTTTTTIYAPAAVAASLGLAGLALPLLFVTGRHLSHSRRNPKAGGKD